MKISHIKKSAIYLVVKIVSGIVFGIGVAIGIYGVYSFQTSTVAPTSTGTGTADNKNTSTTFPMMTRTSTGAYDRNLMSLEAISKMLQSMGALVDDPFPGSVVATSAVTKTNLVRHAASGSKIWSMCYRASRDGVNFSSLRTACTSGGASGKNLLFLSLATNGNVIEAYLNAPLPNNTTAAWVGGPGMYLGFSAPTGANGYYIPNSTNYFYNGVNCFWYTSSSYYSYCLSNGSDATTIKSQFMYVADANYMYYFSPKTLPVDSWQMSGWNTISEVEVWY